MGQVGRVIETRVAVNARGGKATIFHTVDSVMGHLWYWKVDRDDGCHTSYDVEEFSYEDAVKNSLDYMQWHHPDDARPEFKRVLQ